MKVEWPKHPTRWIEDRTLYVSVPFTWRIPDVLQMLHQQSWDWDRAIVGGPAVRLMPGPFRGIAEIGGDMPGVLQRVNPQATRTTVGCPRTCGFCGVKRIEPEFRELEDWPDLPVICDNNLLAASMPHFHRVIDRLVVHGWADFNQGIDARLLTAEHARRLAEIKEPMIRLALDSMAYAEHWERAFGLLREAGIAKRCIRSYAIIGFNDSPAEAWKRCEWVEQHGMKVLPMWYHTLNQLLDHIVTAEQAAHGWSYPERDRIMGWYYKHRGSKPSYASIDIESWGL